MDKKSFILQAIIEEYLKCMEPVSSKQLMDSITIKISSATIRNYFSKLSDEGALSQLHISSGRVPTTLSLINYWADKIDLNNKFKFDSLVQLDEKSALFDIFYVVEINEDNHFVNLINIENNYLLLVFEEFELVLKYNSNYERFLHEFLNHEINELITIAKTLGVFDLASQIENYKNYKNISFGGLKALMCSMIINLAISFGIDSNSARVFL